MKPFVGGTWPSAEQDLLLRACLFDGDEAVRAFEAWWATDQIDRLDEGSFRLLPLLYRNLRRVGLESPADGILKGAYRRAWYLNQTLIRDMSPVLERLERGGFDPIVLKGPALALQYYAELALRPMRDLDVLVPLHRAPEAIRTLRSEGFSSTIYSPDRIGPSWLRYKHSLGLASPQGVELDVHWHVFYRAARPGVTEELRERARPLDLLGFPSRALDPTDQLLLSLSHGPEYNEIPPIRWIADAATMIRAARDRGEPLDWGRIVSCSIAWDLSPWSAAAVRVLSERYQVPIPPTVVDDLSGAPVSATVRAEYDRSMSPRLQSLGDTTRALWGQYRRNAVAKGAVGRAFGFVRFMQHYWELESASKVGPRFLRWVRRRLALGRPPPRDGRTLEWAP